MPKTLLLADDSVTIQKVVGITFANEDVELITVDNGDDALARALEVVPDGILADVTMPGLDGYALCAALKREPRVREVPVMLLTGTFEPFDETRASEVGADAHIAKPFEAQVLVDAVHAMLRRSAAASDETPADAAALEEPSRVEPEAPQIELTEPEPPQVELTEEEPLEFEWAEEAPAAEATPAEPALAPPAPDEAPAFAEADLEPDGPDATRIFPLDELLAGSEGAADAAPPAEPLVAPEPEPKTVAEAASGPQDAPTPRPTPAPELDKELLARTSFPDPQRAESPAPADFGGEDSAELGEGLFDTGSPVPVPPTPTPDDLAAELLDDPAAGEPEPLVETLLEEAEVDPNIDTAPELEPLTLAEDDSRAGAALAEPVPLAEPEEEDLPWLEPMLDDSGRAEAAAATPAEPPADPDDSRDDALFGPALGAASTDATPAPPEPIAMSPITLAPPSAVDAAPETDDFPAAEGSESPFEAAPDLLLEEPEPDPTAAPDLLLEEPEPDPTAAPDLLLEEPELDPTPAPDLAAAAPAPESLPSPAEAFPLASPPTPSAALLAEDAPWPEEAPAPEEAAPAAATAPPIDPERLGEALEKIAWEAFGPLSEHLVREAVKKIEEIAWEVIPQLTERLVREEIERLKAETSGD